MQFYSFPPQLLTIFLYDSVRAAQRICAHSLIPDIALTHSSLLVGAISVYEQALLLAEEGIGFNSKCVSISLFSLSL